MNKAPEKMSVCTHTDRTHKSLQFKNEAYSVEPQLLGGTGVQALGSLKHLEIIVLFWQNI